MPHFASIENNFRRSRYAPSRRRRKGQKMILHARRPESVGPWLVRDRSHTIADLIWPRPELGAMNAGIDAYFEAEPRPGGGWDVKGLAPIQDWD